MDMEGNDGAKDDYAFGMLVNGYPAVVMEVPKAIIIKKQQQK